MIYEHMDNHIRRGAKKVMRNERKKNYNKETWQSDTEIETIINRKLCF